jgi:hypothetical protein
MGFSAISSALTFDRIVRFETDTHMTQEQTWTGHQRHSETDICKGPLSDQGFLPIEKIS